MFSHPASISIPRALAVWRVLHNLGDADTWDVLDAWVAEAGLSAVLDGIESIYAANPTLTWGADEAAWWSRHLARPNAPTS